MPLQKQIVPLPLAKGIDLSIADSLREGDSLSSGKNVEQLITGELTKRVGFSSIATPAETPSYLMPLNNAVTVVGTGGYSETLNTDSNTLAATSSSETGPYTVTVEDLYGSNTTVDCFDSYYASNILYVATATKNSNGYLLQFDNNLNPIPIAQSATQTIAGAPDSVRLCNGFLFAQFGASINVYTITGTLTFVSTIINNNNLTGNHRRWDVMPWSSGGYLLVYDDSSNIVIRIYNSSHSVTASTTTSRTNVLSVCIFPVNSGTDFAVGVNRNVGPTYTSLYRYNSSCVLQGTANSTIATSDYVNMTGIKQTVPGNDRIYFALDIGSSTEENGTRICKLSASFTGTINLDSFITTTVPVTGVASKWFQKSITDYPYLLVTHQSQDTYNIQNCYFLLQHDETLVRFISRLSYGTAPGFISNYNSSVTGAWILPNVPMIGSGNFLGAVRTRVDSSFLTTSASGVYNLRALRLTTDSGFKGKAVEIGTGTFVASNGIYYNDGGFIKPFGFIAYPSGVDSTTNVAAGNVADGTYSYVVVYEYYDSKGNLLESAPSVPYTVTYAAGSARVYNITLEAMTLFEKTVIDVALYRTVASGTIYYRVGSQQVLSPSAGVIISDNLSDATLQTKKLLYTTGGAAENIDPPNCNFIGVGKNRLWTFETGVSDILWFSKEFREGFLPAFSDLLTINMGKTYGPLVGVAQIDDKMIVFKEFGIYVIFGDGPSDNLVGQWSTPTAVVQGMGCIEARSILETTQGVIYQSQEGLYLIDKSLQNQFVGRPLYKNEGTIRAAVYDAAKNCCYFLTTTKLWVFYMTNPSWYEWTVTNPVDLVMSNGVLYLATTTKLLKQTAGVYQDDSTSYEQTVKLGQFQFAGIQGYQRLYRLLVTGRKTSDADATNITAKVYINGNTSVTDTKTIAHSTAISGNRFEIEIRPSIQKCETMELELTQTAATSGMRLSAVTAEVGGLTGGGKRGSDRRL